MNVIPNWCLLGKKLDQIAKLKAEQAAGRVLELNQKEKISKEEEFRKQLDQLSLQNWLRLFLIQ